MILIIVNYDYYRNLLTSRKIKIKIKAIYMIIDNSSLIVLSPALSATEPTMLDTPGSALAFSPVLADPTQVL